MRTRARDRAVVPALALAALLGAGLSPPTAAHADVAIASLPRDTPISAHKGTLAWSKWDTQKLNYRLMLTTVKTGKSTQAKVVARTSPFDVTLGPDSKGRTVALYSRCRNSDNTKCDAYRYDLGKKSERKLDFSRSDRDEVWPAQWQDRYAWVEQRGRSADDPSDFSKGNCDAPLTRPTDSDEAVKELSKGTCGTVTGQALREGTIVQTVAYADDLTRNFSEVRRLSVKGGSAKRVARLQGIQGGDMYSSPLLDDDFYYLIRSGSQTSPRFVRIERSSGNMQQVDAQTPLAGRLARDGSTSFYLEQQVGDPGAPGVACATFRPCRLMRAEPSVFGSSERRLGPRLTFQAPAGAILADQPLALGGTLTVPVVKQGKILRSEPVPGVTLEGLQESDLNNANGENLRFTGRTVATLADGTWSLTVPPPLPPSGWYAAITRTLAVPVQSPPVLLTAVAAAG